MKRFIEYEVEAGKSIIFEVEEASSGMVPAARPDDALSKSEQGFEKALETIGPVTDKLLSKMGEIARAPDEIGIEFGLKLGFKAGAVIASGSTEANFKISISWKQQENARQ